MIQAFAIPAARLAYLKATVMSAAKLCSPQDRCNIRNTTSQELEVYKMVLSFEVNSCWNNRIYYETAERIWSKCDIR
jgi:hypothetical protein